MKLGDKIHVYDFIMLRLESSIIACEVLPTIFAGSKSNSARTIWSAIETLLCWWINLGVFFTSPNLWPFTTVGTNKALFNDFSCVEKQMSHAQHENHSVIKTFSRYLSYMLLKWTLRDSYHVFLKKHLVGFTPHNKFERRNYDSTSKISRLP